MSANRVYHWWASVAVGFLLTSPTIGVEYKKDKPAAKILSPKHDTVVGEVEEVEGRLNTPGGHAVLFVKPLVEGGLFWVQAATETAADGAFTGSVHFGDRLSKGVGFHLVVGIAKSKDEAAKFKPGQTLATLPESLPTAPPVLLYRDERPPPPQKVRSIKFADRTWLVKTGTRVGPGPNDFSDTTENVRVDKVTDYLHLAITKSKDRWVCAEVVADESLGYGEYRWTVAGDLSTLDPRTVLGLFTYETTRREIDFELSRWGDSEKMNAQFVVQPYTAKDSTHRFETGKATVLTCSLVWAKDKVRGRCWEGTDTAKSPLDDWTYSGRNIPPPGKERVRANLWLFNGKPPASGTSQEVVIQSFQFRDIDSKKD